MTPTEPARSPTPAAPTPSRRLIELLKTAAEKWLADRAAQMGAALSYYAAFAIAPLLVVAVSIAGLVVGDQAAEGEIVGQLEGSVGPEAAAFVEGLVERASGGGGAGGAVLGLAIGLIASSALAVNLRRMFNTIWGVPYEQQSGLAAFLRARLASIAVVTASGILVVAVLGASAVFAAVDDLPGFDQAWSRPLLELANMLVGVALAVLAFAALFRFLPAAAVGWRDALTGGTVTSVLFTIGSWGFARYLGTGAVGRGFGAAAALIVLLVFVYYSAQILLFGAEIAAASGRSRFPEPAPAPSREPAELPASGFAAFALGLLLGGLARRRRR